MTTDTLGSVKAWVAATTDPPLIFESVQIVSSSCSIFTSDSLWMEARLPGRGF